MSTAALRALSGGASLFIFFRDAHGAHALLWPVNGWQSVRVPVDVALGMAPNLKCVQPGESVRVYGAPSSRV